MTLHKDKQSLIISNDGTKKGPGYMSAIQLSSGYGDEEPFTYGDLHLIQFEFFPLIWKNSLFMVTNDGNVYRLTNKG